MDYLSRLESKSIYIIREAYKQFHNIALLWSIGKDSVLEDAELYYKIDGKLFYGTIKDLFKSVTAREEYSRGDKKFIIPKENVEVLTAFGKYQKEARIGFGKVSVLISHSTDKDCYEISLQTKRKIKVTGDHSLIGIVSGGNKGLRLEPLEARRLNKKHSVFCPRDYSFDVDDIKTHRGIKIEDYLLTLGGLWLADGCYAVDSKIIISTGGNEGILKFLRSLPRIKPVTEIIAAELKQHPDFNGKNLDMQLARKLAEKHNVSFWASYDAKKRLNRLLSRNENYYIGLKKKGDVWICSKALVTRLKALGFEGTGDNKRVPKWILRASNRQIALFLAGYFAGDGSCWKSKNRYALSICGTNKSMIKALRPLLLRLGIDHGFSSSNMKSAGFRTKHSLMHQVLISSVKSIKQFERVIPDIAGKLEKLNHCNFPPEKSKYAISSRRVREVKKLPSELRKVYDLEIEDTHNFIANGIICHNSTTLLWLARKAFYGKLPFPCLHIDTSYKIPEIYTYRDKYAKIWNLNLVIGRNEKAIAGGMSPKKGALRCCTELKTNALKMTIAEKGYKALLLGIRRDEHGIRAKERVFSPRNQEFQWDYKNQPPELWDQYKSKQSDEQHIRVHPLLHWTEIDIWEYIRRENIPIVSLYFAKNGKRYRSIGCAPCCHPIDSEADTVDKIIEELKTTSVSERSGRSQDKESAYMMQKLRSLGYM